MTYQNQYFSHYEVRTEVHVPIKQLINSKGNIVAINWSDLSRGCRELSLRNQDFAVQFYHRTQLTVQN